MLKAVAVRTAGGIAAALALALASSAARAAPEHVLGDPAAPVTIIEYASLTCPHCAAFHGKDLPALKERYIDTGKVKLVYRDFPLDGVAAQAAVVVHCANDDRYFTFLSAVYANQETWARSADPIGSLKQLAKLGGLPEAKSSACLADKTMQDAVLQSRLTGEKTFDVKSTPTLIINGETYDGGRGIDDFAEVIEPLIKG